MAAVPTISSAFITAAGALAVAVLSAWTAYRAQKRALDNQVELQRYQKDLKRLQSDLDERRADRDARRDYEYDALKRLYQECSPLLFVLAEQAADAYSRIKGIAKTAKNGDLSGPNSWLTSERFRYYRLSTEYRLLAPLATLKLLQQRLTQFDLSLEPEIRMIYALGRQASRVMADDFELAAASGKTLAYDPHCEGAASLTHEQEAIYYQQGVPRGILDNAVESLILRDNADRPRVMSFSEYEVVRTTPGGNTHQALSRIEYLLGDFHPRSRPVLWRVLLTTAGIYRSLVLVADRSAPNAASLSEAELMDPLAAEKEDFDWRENEFDGEGEEAVVQAHTAVNAYLQKTIAHLVKRDLPGMTQARQAQRK